MSHHQLPNGPIQGSFDVVLRRSSSPNRHRRSKTKEGVVNRFISGLSLAGPGVGVWASIACLLLLGRFFPPPALGHPMVHEKIDHLTLQISHEPPNATLLLRRGRLYIEIAEYIAARTDFERALKIDRNTRAAHYYLGHVALKTARYHEAVRHARTFISAVDHEAGALVRGYRLLAAAYDRLQDYKRAAGAYQTVVDVAAEPRPSFFLDLVAIYLKQKQYASSMRVLARAIDRLGPLAVFEEQALKIEIVSHAYGMAIKRIDRLINIGQRLPVLYEQKGRILEMDGRADEAEQAYRRALAEWNRLPIGRRHSPAMLSLRDRLMSVLGSIPKVDDEPSHTR